MRNVKRSSCWMFITTAVTLSAWFLTFPTRGYAQSQGNNAVYNSSAICSSSTDCGFSGAFIDASTFGRSNTDFCAVLYNVLKNIVPATTGRGCPSFPAYLEKGPCAQSAAADRNPEGAPSKLRWGGDFPRLNASQK